MATYPSPIVPSFLAGAQLQSTDFTTLWNNTVLFLQNKIVFRASQTSAATTLPSNGSTAQITFDTVLEDPYSGWNSSTHTWTPPSGYTGWFWASVTLRTATLQNNVSIAAEIAIINQQPFVLIAPSPAVMGSSNAAAGCSGGTLLYLVGGQTGVQVFGYAANGSVNVSTTLTAGQQSTLEITWLTL